MHHGLPTAGNAPCGGMKQGGWGRELGAFLEPRPGSPAFDAG